MVQQGWRKDVIVPDADQVGWEILGGEKRGDRELELRKIVVVPDVVADVVRDEHSVVLPESLIDADGFDSADNRIGSGKGEVIGERIGRLRNVAHDGLGDRANWRVDDVVGIGGATLLTVNGLGGRGVKDLACADRSSVAGVDDLVVI